MERALCRVKVYLTEVGTWSCLALEEFLVLVIKIKNKKKDGFPILWMVMIEIVVDSFVFSYKRTCGFKDQLLFETFFNETVCRNTLQTAFFCVNAICWPVAKSCSVQWVSCTIILWFNWVLSLCFSASKCLSLGPFHSITCYSWW